MKRAIFILITALAVTPHGLFAQEPRIPERVPASAVEPQWNEHVAFCPRDDYQIKWFVERAAADSALTVIAGDSNSSSYNAIALPSITTGSGIHCNGCSTTLIGVPFPEAHPHFEPWCIPKALPTAVAQAFGWKMP